MLRVASATSNDCDAYVSLGKAKIPTIERAAAELHDRTGGDAPRGLDDSRYTRAQRIGWSIHYWNQRHQVPETAGQWVGYLARAMAEP